MTISLQNIFKYSCKDVFLSRQDVLRALWLPALGLSIVEVLLYRWGGDTSSLVTLQTFLEGTNPENVNPESITSAVLHSALFMLLFSAAHIVAQGFVGAFWLLRLQNKENQTEHGAFSQYHLRHPVYQNFLRAWILISLMGMGITMSVVFVVGLFFVVLQASAGGFSVSAVVLSVMLSIPFSCYVLGRCSMVLPASLTATQEERFRKSWQNTAPYSRELAWLLFLFFYVLPIVFMVPSQILQSITRMIFGWHEGMTTALLAGFIHNLFMLSTVLLLISGLFYVYAIQQNRKIKL